MIKNDLSVGVSADERLSKKQATADNNELKVSGYLLDKYVSHVLRDVTYYSFYVQVPRKNENSDVLHIIVSERLLFNNPIEIGDCINITGQIRSRNVFERNRSRLSVFGYADNVVKIAEEELVSTPDRNIVILEGYNCRPTRLRDTHSGRIITDIMLANNRLDRKANYIPCIAWGVQARQAERFRLGEKIRIVGRLQSRTFTYRDGDETFDRTVYEVSIQDVTVLYGEGTGLAAMEGCGQEITEKLGA